MDKYIVCWRSKITGKGGHGQPINLTDAQSWVRLLNKNYPLTDHWIEPAEQPHDWALLVADAVYPEGVE